LKETLLRTTRTTLRARILACAAAITLPLLLAACGGNDDDPLVRKTHLGEVKGVEEAATQSYAWKGIPFAKAPTGALRWQPPQEPDAWTSAKTTTAFGPACAQYGRIYGPGSNNRYDETIATTLNTAVGSEDCLYLNVWRPASGEERLPVIVFLHGGSNVSGYTADPIYDGATLARVSNAVVVTPNFRLGILGFLNLTQLKNGNADNDSGNFTMLDSIKALEFVRKNAAAFGGNPDNVTVMGQSAGAINVWALQTSPKMVAANPKLFHRVVPLSGGISLATNLPAGSLPTLFPAAVYQAQGNALLQNQLIVDGLATDAASAQAYIAGHTNAQLAEYMRSKTPSALFTTLLTRLALLGLGTSGPIPDGTVVASDPVGAITAGNYVKVPVLAGNTRDEGKLFPSFLPLVGGTGNARLVTDAQLFTNHLTGAATTIDQWIAPSYLPVNAPTTGFTARAEALNKIFFLASRDNVLNALKGQQPNVWYYRFDWDEQPAPWNDIYGAVHVVDLPFIFGNFGPSLFGNVWFNNANRPGRTELSATMMATMSAFARNGDPNSSVLGLAWPAWPSKMVFDASPTVRQLRVE
jgi:para-nitrobenzyl esterase